MYKIRDWLYIGKFAETRRRELLEDTGITAMLLLAQEVTHPNIESLYVALEDGEPMAHDKIKEGIAFIREQKEKGKVVLVACGAGISRSTIFSMAAIMEEEDFKLFDAYGEVYQYHRSARPHHELCISLSEYYGKELDLLEVHDGLKQTRKKIDEARV